MESCICLNLFYLLRPRDRQNKGLYVNVNYVCSTTKMATTAQRCLQRQHLGYNVFFHRFFFPLRYFNHLDATCNIHVYQFNPVSGHSQCWRSGPPFHTGLVPPASDATSESHRQSVVINTTYNHSKLIHGLVKIKCIS